MDQQTTNLCPLLPQGICKKTSKKEVTPFDVQDQRLDGTDAEKFKVSFKPVSLLKSIPFGLPLRKRNAKKILILIA